MMTKVRVDKFCSLATSPSWQAWLFHLDHDLYRRFIKKLQQSRGCSHNRDLMVEILKEIDKIDSGGPQLIEFLTKHYPTMLVTDDSQPRLIRQDQHESIFDYYNPHILTYPRRMILIGTPTDLKQRVQEFLLDKIQTDFVIVGDRAYIEYLKAEDASIKDQIPTKNWQVAAWRLRQ
jgi:hypothetical protein